MKSSISLLALTVFLTLANLTNLYAGRLELRIKDDRRGFPVTEAIFLLSLLEGGKNQWTQPLSDNGSCALDTLPPGKYLLQVWAEGYEAWEKEFALGEKENLKKTVRLQSTVHETAGIVSYFKVEGPDQLAMSAPPGGPDAGAMRFNGPIMPPVSNNPPSREVYAHYPVNRWRNPELSPLSTLAVDVDRASYANVRRFLNQGTLPPPDAVRLEELVNYFHYTLPAPRGDDPLSIAAETAVCPWDTAHILVKVDLQAVSIPETERPAANLVFLVDVSGSMGTPRKLPLLKKALQLLVNRLGPQDRVAIVTYAGSAGIALPSTPGNRKDRILQALVQLNAGGATAGEAGIRLAYGEAGKAFRKNGANRVILCTDGDFNVGTANTGELVNLVTEKKKQGIQLTILGFGMGNYQDARLEQLADKGDGNYGYVDNLGEARKMLVRELTGTLFTVARDVKLQVEFNPARVKAYRLLGYENRLLNPEDFLDDTVDGGEMGAGHSVTALYEVVPVGAASPLPQVEPLKYQPPGKKKTPKDKSELLTVKARWQSAGRFAAGELRLPLAADKIPPCGKASEDFRFAAAVAEFALLLNRHQDSGTANWEEIVSLARNSRGDDPHGDRGEFLRLVETAQSLWELEVRRDD